MFVIIFVEIIFVGFVDIQSILIVVIVQFFVSNIVVMIVGILGVIVGFVFLWWGVCKGFCVIVFVVIKGKFKV